MKKIIGIGIQLLALRNMKSSRKFQDRLRCLKDDMISCIKKNCPIDNIDERIDVITSNWDGAFLKTATLKSITESGDVITDDYNYEIDDICIYDLAWLCDYYCKR